MPHFHLLVQRDAKGLDALRAKLLKGRNLGARPGVKNRPMMVKKVTNPPEQVSYLYKTMWSRIELFSTERRERNTKKYRLRESQLALSLRKLDQIGFAGLEFLYGVRRHGSHLQVNLSTSKKSK
jgi:hypothetical protein